MLRKLLARLRNAIRSATNDHAHSTKNELNEDRPQGKVIRIYPQPKKHSATIIRIY